MENPNPDDGVHDQIIDQLVVQVKIPKKILFGSKPGRDLPVLDRIAKDLERALF